MKCFSRIFWDVPKYQKAVRSLVSPDMSCPYSLLSMLSFEKAILEIGYYGNLSFNSQVQVPRTFLYLVTLWFVKVQGVGGRVRVSWQNGFRGGEGTNNHNYFNCQVSRVYFWQNKRSIFFHQSTTTRNFLKQAEHWSNDSKWSRKSDEWFWGNYGKAITSAWYGSAVCWRMLLTVQLTRCTWCKSWPL